MDSRKILISTASEFLVLIFGTLSFYFLRLYFSIEQIGEYGVIISFFGTFSFLNDLGFSLAHLKHFAEAKTSEEEAKYNGAFLFFQSIQISSYFVLIVILIPILQIYPQDIYLVFMFLLADLFLKSGNIFRPIFYSKKKVVKKAISDLSLYIFKLLLVLLLGMGATDLWSFFWINFLSSVIYFVISLFFLRGINIQKPSKEFIYKYFKYAYPFFITTSMQIIVSHIDVLFISFWFPIEDVANYYTAKQIYGYIALFSNSISNILINTFSKNLSEGNKAKNLELIDKIEKFLGIFMVAIVFLASLYSTRILIFFFGDDYQLTGILLSILVINFIQISVGKGISLQLSALGETKYIAWTTIIRHILAILLQVIFISPYLLNLGAIGGALAFSIVGILMSLIFRPITYIKFGLRFSWRIIGYVIIMGGVALLQFYINQIFLYEIYFIPLFVLFDLLLFLSILYLTKGISKADILYIYQIVNPKEIKKIFFSEISEEWE